MIEHAAVGRSRPRQRRAHLEGADRRATACRAARRGPLRPCASRPCARWRTSSRLGLLFRMLQQRVVISGHVGSASISGKSTSCAVIAAHRSASPASEKARVASARRRPRSRPSRCARRLRSKAVLREPVEARPMCAPAPVSALGVVERPSCSGRELTRSVSLCGKVAPKCQKPALMAGAASAASRW